jgi:transcriptional regulator with PAS, ATPase and Fis domain
VRELENVMKRVAALSSGDPVVTADGMLPFLAHGAQARPNGSKSGNGHAPIADERGEILSAYAEARGNKSRVAAMLGVSRKTLYARLKRLSLELP